LSWTNSKPDWDTFIGLLSPGPRERILDVGAGKGAVAAGVYKASNGAEVYAVDPNEKQVTRMKKAFPEVRTSVAGAEKLPFADSDFDKAYTTMALHHFTDLDRALGEIARVLKHGGTFVVLEVEPHSMLGRMFRFFESLVGEHVNIISEGQLLSKLSAQGGFGEPRSVRLGARYLIQLKRI
jgi:ubiquinone/menaquinone biosynthesis C-methylase UbiE